MVSKLEHRQKRMVGRCHFSLSNISITSSSQSLPKPLKPSARRVPPSSLHVRSSLAPRACEWLARRVPPLAGLGSASLAPRFRPDRPWQHAKQGEDSKQGLATQATSWAEVLDSLDGLVYMSLFNYAALPETKCQKEPVGWSRV